MEVLTNLELYRRQSGLSQKELATMVGASQGQISILERRGKHSKDATLLTRIKTVLSFPGTIYQLLDSPVILEEHLKDSSESAA